MPRGDKDHGANWLIQNHPAALLRLLGLSNIRSCRTAHPRLTLPEAIPDGLLEVSLPGQEPLHFLLEMETYPSIENDAVATSFSSSSLSADTAGHRRAATD
jgi:hypothetical protein